jgi:N-acetylmuramoyl-L-alanine amidase
MRPIHLIVIHCTGTLNGDSLFRGSPGTSGLQTPVAVIDGWHKAKKFHRQPADRQRQNQLLEAIGYHYVVYLDGSVATGRHLDEEGAHVAGHNRKSIGICLIGTDGFTADQWDALAGTVRLLLKRYPDARVVGHRDLSPDLNGDGTIQPREWLKICPGFDVAAWLAGGMAPLSDHLLEN